MPPSPRAVQGVDKKILTPLQIMSHSKILEESIFLKV
jgi:hypothetical protein